MFSQVVSGSEEGVFWLATSLPGEMTGLFDERRRDLANGVQRCAVDAKKSYRAATLLGVREDLVLPVNAMRPIAPNDQEPSPRDGELAGAARRYCAGQSTATPSSRAARKGQYGSRSSSRASNTQSDRPSAMMLLA